MKAVVKDIKEGTFVRECYFVRSMRQYVGTTIEVRPEPEDQNEWYRQVRPSRGEEYGGYWRYHRSWLQFLEPKRPSRPHRLLPKIELYGQTTIANWTKGRRTYAICVPGDNFDPLVGLALVCLKGNYTAGEINRMLLNVKVHTKVR